MKTPLLERGFLSCMCNPIKLWLTTYHASLVQNEISQRLLDGLPQSLVQPFMGPLSMKPTDMLSSEFPSDLHFAIL